MSDAPETRTTAAEPKENSGMVSAAQNIWSNNEQTWKDVTHGKGTVKEDLVVAAEVGAGVALGAYGLGLGVGLAAGELGYVGLAYAIGDASDALVLGGTILAGAGTAGAAGVDLWDGITRKPNTA